MVDLDDRLVDLGFCHLAAFGVGPCEQLVARREIPEACLVGGIQLHRRFEFVISLRHDPELVGIGQRGLVGQARFEFTEFG